MGVREAFIPLAHNEPINEKIWWGQDILTHKSNDLADSKRLFKILLGGSFIWTKIGEDAWT